MLYSDWLQIWLKDKQNYIKESTYANYSTVIHSYIIPTFTSQQLSDITEQLVQQETLNWIRKDGLSCSTVKNIVMIIKSSLRAAQKTNLTTPQIIDILYPKAYSSDTPKILTKLDQAKLVQSAYLDLSSRSAGVLLALSTGIRIGELCGLKWSDVNFTNQTISVQRTIQRIYDPGADIKTRIVIGEPKTISSKRTVPISTTMLPILYRLKSSQNSDYVLTGTSMFVEPRTYREYFNSLLKKSDIEHINFHALRHTFATRLIENGADYKTVSTILGHSSINMTLNLYVHPQLSQQRSAIELFSLLT